LYNTYTEAGRDAAPKTLLLFYAPNTPDHLRVVWRSLLSWLFYCTKCEAFGWACILGIAQEEVSRFSAFASVVCFRDSIDSPLNCAMGFILRGLGGGMNEPRMGGVVLAMRQCALSDNQKLTMRCHDAVPHSKLCVTAFLALMHEEVRQTPARTAFPVQEYRPPTFDWDVYTSTPPNVISTPPGSA
jgi:hypothetical protein